MNNLNENSPLNKSMSTSITYSSQKTNINNILNDIQLEDKTVQPFIKDIKNNNLMIVDKPIDNSDELIKLTIEKLNLLLDKDNIQNKDDILININEILIKAELIEKINSEIVNIIVDLPINIHD